jgi:hypothetical protein
MLVDRSVAHSQEAQYHAHLASLGDQLGVCDLLLNRIEEVENEVGHMLEEWRGVEGGTSLQGACERLQVLEENVRLCHLSLNFSITQLKDSLHWVVDDIGSHLEYFQELKHATRMLNSRRIITLPA